MSAADSSSTREIERVSRLIARALRSGKTVDVDGLGRFEPGADGKPEFIAQQAPQVFIAYVVEDFEFAKQVFDALRAAGCSPWLDKEKLLPGQNWPRAIERAIEIADAFVPCFSPRSINKRGPFQAELRYALDCARRRPLDDSFVIPVRLEKCEVPRRIRDQVQYVDLFPDWQRGIRKLIRAVKHTGRRTPHTNFE
ncbi:MAG: TIR domain-containing protein [Bryobacteraceae bacterium]